jgi:protein subunit release factor B
MSTALRDQDLEVTFFRASGPGGQHRNRRETGVRIRHLPTGLVVTATERRSQAENKEVALERLIEALARRNRKRKKRIPTRATRASQERRIQAKKSRAQVKAGRGKVSGD